MPGIDFEAFRLRRLVERLIDAGEVEIHDEPVALANIAGLIEASDKCVLFRAAGPEQLEIVGGVAGSRRRLAFALGVAPHDIALDYLRRMTRPQAVVEVPSADAPVQHTVFTNEAIDLTRLPFHLQHQLDGAPYISSAIDFSIDPATGRRNVGCRRLMLCGKRELRTNLTQLSDLKRTFIAAAARGEHLPVNFAIGSHPADLLAASVRLPLDEYALVGTMRGQPVPMTRARTNDLLVPADAELIIEGYFDKAGYSAPEGPYGELLGYYGPVHDNPIYRVTAITMRHDVLHQTVLHGAVLLARTEAAQIGGLLLEARIWETLRAAGIHATAVNGCAATGGMISARVATDPGQGRRAIGALFAVPFLKHIVVTDATIDVFSDEQVEWAMASRFRPDRDLLTSQAQVAFPMDLSATHDRQVTKIGYDLTQPLQAPGIRSAIARAPCIVPARRFTTVHAALADGAKPFATLMADLGSSDGREIVLELDALGAAVARREDGAWCLSNN